MRLNSALLLLTLAPLLPAHEIPSDVAVQAFVKPEGQTLRLLVRVPLRAMRDTMFPEREKGYLDFDRVDPLLVNVSNLWISDYIDVLEGETQLPKPRVIATRLSLESDKSFASYEQAL